MRDVKDIIQSQMDYILSKIYAESLYESSVISKKELNKVLRLLKEKYDPPTEMLEGYNDKKGSENR